MKMTKKKVLALALCLCLLATVAAGSLAWFSAEDSVTNQFLIADSGDDDQADFSVNVEESDDEGTSWDDGGLVYEDILPGQIKSLLHHGRFGILSHSSENEETDANHQEEKQRKEDCDLSGAVI